MQDMKLSSAERRDATMMEDPQEPQYPYGLRIYMDGNDMEKLDNPSLSVGDKVLVVALAEVTDTSEHSSSDGTSRSTSLQIQKMELKDPDEAERKLKRLFPEG